MSGEELKEVQQTDETLDGVGETLNGEHLWSWSKKRDGSLRFCVD